MPGVSSGYLGPDQMVILSFPLYSGPGPHGLAFCLSFPPGLQSFAESQHSGLRPYTLPGSSKTFSLGRKKSSSLFPFFLLPDSHCLSNNWLGSCLNTEEYHCIIKIECLVPDLNTSWWGASGLTNHCSFICQHVG